MAASGGGGRSPRLSDWGQQDSSKCDIATGRPQRVRVLCIYQPGGLCTGESNVAIIFGGKGLNFPNSIYFAFSDVMCCFIIFLDLTISEHRYNYTCTCMRMSPSAIISPSPSHSHITCIAIQVCCV